MMRFVIASGNKHKIEEIKYILQTELGREIEVVSIKEMGFTDEIEENGNTFLDNAFIKADAIAGNEWFSIADDSGLSVDHLNGAPGVYSARFAGQPCNDLNNNNKLLSLLENVPAEKRSAHFVSSIACVTPKGDRLSAVGTCEGQILFAPRGNGGFGYDPLFYYAALDKTFAEITPEEKNAISHRANAMNLFANNLKKYLEENPDVDK